MFYCQSFEPNRQMKVEDLFFFDFICNFGWFKVVLVSGLDMECGFSREIFLEWCADVRNTVIVTGVFYSLHFISVLKFPEVDESLTIREFHFSHFQLFFFKSLLSDTKNCSLLRFS